MEKRLVSIGSDNTLANYVLAIQVNLCTELDLKSILSECSSSGCQEEERLDDVSFS